MSGVFGLVGRSMRPERPTDANHEKCGILWDRFRMPRADRYRRSKKCGILLHSVAVRSLPRRVFGVFGRSAELERLTITLPARLIVHRTRRVVDDQARQRGRNSPTQRIDAS